MNHSCKGSDIFKLSIWEDPLGLNFFHKKIPPTKKKLKNKNIFFLKFRLKN
jgi:hypothetical protein